MGKTGLKIQGNFRNGRSILQIIFKDQYNIHYNYDNGIIGKHLQDKVGHM